MKIEKYEITWVIRYLFPSVFIVLFIGGNLFQPFSLNRGDYTDSMILIAEIVVVYFAIYFLTVRYEISKNQLIIKSLFLWKKSIDFESIQLIDEDGIFHLFYQIPIGVDLTVLTLKNGKIIRIIGLKEPLKFIQEIRSYQLSLDES
jgi:hypothetical protein